ncbi:RsmD family RNA methyltransferase [Riemerella columbipharyngis]|uniref:16S rRNA (Guanine(966)-N(2))-methyltransferase RsmD n=1 Tax=Riemerella columbipharyngis TaxID=1071918 RepID=A0A1G7AXN5_9FLAO|nr:RsmD family RNA methyltransferase [Riemerella columbipharyngis]SDE19531.1 16S rRNA (guanine(966)-N(2))-methyltransferase RsmD [Riemerella columbipharyngis]
MYRIISGKWKAKRIVAPKNFEVRPTTNFAKEALFSMIEHRFDLQSVKVLDLFAGIGSIALEFASRYCPDVVAVEIHPKHTDFINTTAQDLELGLQVDVQKSDVFEWLKKKRYRGKSFDIIFADPPFQLPENKYKELIELILDNSLLTENGILILEHHSKMNINYPNISQTRKYGNVSFSFIENSIKP